MHLSITRVVGVAVSLLTVTLLRPLPAGAAGPTRYEAESATISKGAVESNHLHFSGTGFVDNDNVSGSYTEWTVDAASAGSATLTFRYANGTTTARPADIAVNGTVVAAATSFGSTANWDTWADKTVTATLAAGANKIRVTGTSSNGPPNLDYLDVDTGSAAPAVAWQAENATLSQAAFANDHAGFTGTGFVDYTNVTGGSIEWTVNAPEAGTQTLTLRYANGTSANRPLDIAVNGTPVATGVAFNATANWDTWADKSVTAPLSAGSNTIRATATTSNGGPNVDALTVTGTTDTQPPTAPGTPTQAGLTSTTATVAWTASGDNAGVASYDLVTDGRVCGTAPAQTLTGTCSGLTPDTDAAITVVARDASGNVSPASGALTVHTPPDNGPGNPYGDPNLVSMFNGTTLDGWTQSRSDGWVVQNGAIHGTGAGRGWIFYNPKQVGTFRWIFTERQVKGDHAPTVLIWGTTQQPYLDALGGIQFQPPNGGHWDYRPGHNDGGGSLFKQLPHDKIDVHAWSQCELIGNMSTGVARMACCPLSGTATTCKATEVLQFKDPTAGRVGPLAIQIHNSGINDEYRNLYLESPVVTKPDGFITTS
jgi:hypothetical protein